MSSLRSAGARTPRRSLFSRLVLTTRKYGLLGFTAFGGPTANIVYIRRIFVTKEGWIDDETFNDLLALGNALPGPGFSQLAFAISCLHDGTLCGLWSFVLLTAPGAIFVTAAGFGVQQIPSTLPGIVFALFTGINAATVGLVALAAHRLSNKVVTDQATRVLLLLSGAIASCYESQWLYPVLMVAGGLTTLLVDRFNLYQAQQILKKSNTAKSPPVTVIQPEEIEMQLPRPVPRVASKSNLHESMGTTATLRRTFTNRSESIERYPTPSLEREGHREEEESTPVEEEETYFTLTVKQGLLMCVSVSSKFTCIVAGADGNLPLHHHRAAAFFVIFITMLATRGAMKESYKELDFATNLLLAGTIIFGGGPVVIPLLRGYVVDPGYVSPRDFLLGFAIQQACPGPLFSFTAYLGVLVFSSSTASSLGGALLGVLSIFLPGIMLKLAFLPLYQRWKTATLVRSILRGFNAAAVGLIYSAIYRLFRVGFIEAAPISSATSDGAISRSLD
ncbi:uncharacterized protein JCM6883_007518 [Sporobolomyces salmoneus]|uniref:uncharacterized protein n=1 Tax=Sporobolomyces salmoneus TaxID=183962 RepID=UPI00316F2688